MVCRCPNDAVHNQRYAQSEADARRASEDSFKEQIAALEKEIAALTAKPEHYDILQAVQQSGCLILRVKYPSCTKCTFDGVKILVFDNVSVLGALQWKRIDPHFRAGPFNANEAPCPAARFPNTEEGWESAIRFAKLLGGGE